MLYFPGQNLTAEEVSWAAGGGAPGATVEVTYLRPLVSGGRVQSVMPDDAWFRTARLTSRVSGKLAVLYKALTPSLTVRNGTGETRYQSLFA